MSGDDRTFAMMAKPVSSACNLRCEYCYYTGKRELLQVGPSRMSDDVLEAFVRQNLAMHGRNAAVEFAWHGGEPVLAGLPFFVKALALEKKYGKGRKIRNSLQTNGTLLDDAWCSFFKENGFLVGVSVDGPRDLHDASRKSAEGGPSFYRVMHGIGLLQKHGVPFNTLTTVNSVNMGHPEEVYSFLRKLTDHMQFLPVVESLPQDVEAVRGMRNAIPPGLYTLGALRTTAPFSVTGSGYGSFLCAVYDVWKRLDMGRKHVQLIDVAIENLKGRPASLCVHDPLCGHSGTVESNGDVYCCDRYAYENYRLGNIMRESLADLMERNRPFGMSKTYGLGSFCFECPYVKLCFGGCPKDRLDGSLNYLCKGYKMFFQRICEDREMLTAL